MSPRQPEPAEFDAVLNPRPARTVTAKTRKRCPGCRKMIEAGESVVLTDDRYSDSRVQWGGRTFRRGSWHLWHPACRPGAR